MSKDHIDLIAEYVASIDLTGSKILIVDDVPLNIRILSRSLTTEGYDILTASNGAKALEVATHSAPDLILLDVMMPDMDGFETCRRLKLDQSTRTIPVIFVTARNDTQALVQGFRIGGVDYIVKPFRREEVLMRVETHLKISRLTEELSLKNAALAQSLEKEQRLSERLLRLSMEDSMTGVYNRRYFFERIEQEIKRAKRKKEKIVIAIFDLDFFKEVNDTYGHLCGDAVLKAFSSIVSQNIRETDMVARYGGEEFIVAFFEVKREGISKRLNFLRETIESHTFVFEENRIKKTVSIGFTIYQFDHNSNKTIQALIDEADTALYQAKKTGKNKVVFFGDLTDKTETEAIDA